MELLNDRLVVESDFYFSKVQCGQIHYLDKRKAEQKKKANFFEMDHYSNRSNFIFPIINL